MDFVNLTLQREKPHRKVVQTWLDRLEASWRVVWDQSRVVRGEIEPVVFRALVTKHKDASCYPIFSISFDTLHMSSSA